MASTPIDWDLSETPPSSPITEYTGPDWATDKWTLAVTPATRSIRVIHQGEHVFSVFTNRTFSLGQDHRILTLRLWSRSSTDPPPSEDSKSRIRVKVGVRIEENRRSPHRLPSCSYFKTICHNGACVACGVYGSIYHHYARGDWESPLQFSEGGEIRIRVRGTKVAFCTSSSQSESESSESVGGGWVTMLEEIDLAESWAEELRSAREENGAIGVQYRFFVCFSSCDGEVQIVSLEEIEEEEEEQEEGEGEKGEEGGEEEV